MKIDGNASCLKITEKFLGCALQKINSGIKTARERQMTGSIHFGQCFFGWFEKIP